MSDAEHAVCFMAHSDGRDDGMDASTADLIPALRNALPELLRALAIAQAVEEDIGWCRRADFDSIKQRAYEILAAHGVK
jgi:hypothetical protein